jgi:hypothetical protein
MSKTLKMLALTLLFTGAYTATIDPAMAKKKCVETCKKDCNRLMDECYELFCETKPEDDREGCKELCIKQKLYCYTKICKCK